MAGITSRVVDRRPAPYACQRNNFNVALSRNDADGEGETPVENRLVILENSQIFSFLQVQDHPPKPLVFLDSSSFTGGILLEVGARSIKYTEPCRIL